MDLGGCPVAVTDRVHYRLVGAAGSRMHGPDAPTQDAAPDLVKIRIQTDQCGVVAGSNNRSMELGVGFQIEFQFTLAPDLIALLQQQFEPLQIGVRPPLRREPRAAGRKFTQEFGDILGWILREPPLHHSGQLTGGDDIGTGTLADIQQPVVGQRADGFPNGVPGDAELLDEGLLSGNPVPNRPIPLGDTAAQLVDYLFDQGLTARLRQRIGRGRTGLSIHPIII